MSCLPLIMFHSSIIYIYIYNPIISLFYTGIYRHTHTSSSSSICAIYISRHIALNYHVHQITPFVHSIYHVITFIIHIICHVIHIIHLISTHHTSCTIYHHTSSCYPLVLSVYVIVLICFYLSHCITTAPLDRMHIHVKFPLLIQVQSMFLINHRS